MLSRSVLSFRTCYSLLLLRGIYIMVSNFGALQYVHGRFPEFLFFGFAPNRSILCIGSSFIMCVSFVDIRASGSVFFLFFFPYVFCSISLIIFFISRFFFLSLFYPVICLSGIAVMYFDISNSSAEIVLKLHSFSISINRLQNSSSVSSSVCFAQKSLRLW